jgi:hypothetical protein
MRSPCGVVLQNFCGRPYEKEKDREGERANGFCYDRTLGVKMAVPRLPMGAGTTIENNLGVFTGDFKHNPGYWLFADPTQK